jgi:hypothetical protein
MKNTAQHTSPLKISFCITCKGRRDHLEQTLPENLRRNADYPQVEFVVLDYDSRDGLQEWIRQHFQKEIAEGRLRYVRYAPAEHFLMAHAKNMAHRAATGDVLCNLDADNITGQGFAGWLNEQFQQDMNLCVRPRWNLVMLHNRFTKKPMLGMGGRIAMSRENFMKLGGYDEIYKAWGHEDTNLDNRAKQAGLLWKELPHDQLGDVIEHSHTRRWAQMSLADQELSRNRLERPPECRWKHRLGILANTAGIFPEIVDIANSRGSFGCGTVYINFSNTPTEIGAYQGPRFLNPFTFGDLRPVAGSEMRR